MFKKYGLHVFAASVTFSAALLLFALKRIFDNQDSQNEIDYSKNKGNNLQQEEPDETKNESDSMNHNLNGYDETSDLSKDQICEKGDAIDSVHTNEVIMEQVSPDEVFLNYRKPGVYIDLTEDDEIEASSDDFKKDFVQTVENQTNINERIIDLTNEKINKESGIYENYINDSDDLEEIEELIASENISHEMALPENNDRPEEILEDFSNSNLNDDEDTSNISGKQISDIDSSIIEFKTLNSVDNHGSKDLEKLENEDLTDVTNEPEIIDLISDSESEITSNDMDPKQKNISATLEEYSDQTKNSSKSKKTKVLEDFIGYKMNEAKIDKLVEDMLDISELSHKKIESNPECVEHENTEEADDKDLALSEPIETLSNSSKEEGKENMSPDLPSPGNSELYSHYNDLMTAFKNNENGNLSPSSESWPLPADGYDKCKGPSSNPANSIQSPAPRSESDMTIEMNNKTEVVATGLVESLWTNGSITPIAEDEFEHAKFMDNKGKIFNVVYLTNEQAHHYGLQECKDRIFIRNEIPSSYAGRLLGKKGKKKSKLYEKFNAHIVITDNLAKPGYSDLQISCPKSQEEGVRKWLDREFHIIENDVVQTVVSRPDMLKTGFKLGVLFPLQVLHMDNDMRDIRIRIIDEEASKSFTKMRNRMQQHYSVEANRKRMPYPINVGAMCVAKYGNEYNRATVVQIADKCFVTLYFVDIGKILDLTIDDLFKMGEPFLKFKFRAIPAQLSNVLAKPEYQCHTPSIYKKLLYNTTTKVPHPVYGFISHMNNCCVPSIHLYIPKSIIDKSVPITHDTTIIKTGNSLECVDFAELVYKTGFIDLPIELIMIEKTQQATRAHLKTYNLINDQNRDLVLYQPPNFYEFYQDIIQYTQNGDDNSCKIFP